MCRIDGRVRWLPNNYIAHHGTAAWQVTCNSCKVERCKRINKTLQRSPLHTVPDTRGRVGLHSIYLRHKLHIKAQKVYDLASRINFRLESIFALTQIGRAS